MDLGYSWKELSQGGRRVSLRVYVIVLQYHVYFLVLLLLYFFGIENMSRCDGSKGWILNWRSCFTSRHNWNL